jgi:hypothetical protein
VAEKQYTFTRAQLIDALTCLEVRVPVSGPLAGKVLADSMADALITALEEECQTSEVRYVQSSDQASSGDGIT